MSFQQNFEATQQKIRKLLEGGTGSVIIPLNLTANHTLTLSDEDKVIRMDSTSARTITVPSNAAAAFPIGFSIPVRNLNTGIVTIINSGGVTFNGSGTYTLAKDASAVLYKAGINEWDIYIGGAGATPLAQLSAPILSRTVIGYNQIDIGVSNPPTGADTLIVERDTSSAFSSPTNVYGGAPPTTPITIHDSSLSGSTTYYYRAKWQGTGYADSNYSTAVNGTTPAAPVLVFDDDFSVPLIVSATISGGVITGLTPVSGNTGFLSTPTITISAPSSGTTATATAVMTGTTVSGFTITNGGSGYTGTPTIATDYSTSLGWSLFTDGSGGASYFAFGMLNTHNYLGSDGAYKDIPGHTSGDRYRVTVRCEAQSGAGIMRQYLLINPPAPIYPAGGSNYIHNTDNPDTFFGTDNWVDTSVPGTPTDFAWTTGPISGSTATLYAFIGTYFNGYGKTRKIKVERL